MVTSTAVLDRARSRLGQVGGSEFNAYVGQSPASPWCAAFASWVYGGLGIANPCSGWTPSWVAWAKTGALWRDKSTAPEPGDAVLFFWPGVSAAGRGIPPVCHIGIVEFVPGDGTIYSVEGNTSGTAFGSQYNGNLCARRLRTRSTIQGFIRMPVDAAVGPAPTPHPESDPTPPLAPDPYNSNEDDDMAIRVLIDETDTDACWDWIQGTAPVQVTDIKQWVYMREQLKLPVETYPEEYVRRLGGVKGPVGTV